MVALLLFMSFLYWSRDMLGDDVPVLQLLKHLTANGWLPQREPVRHDDSSPKHFGSGNYVGRRHYLQCLVHLSTLLASGLESLSAKQSATYYHKLLVADDPRSLNVSSDLEQRHITPAVADIDSDNEMIVTSRVDAPAAKRQRLDVPSNTPTVEQVPDAVTENILNLVEQMDGPAGNGIGSNTLSGDSSSGSSSSTSSSDSDSDSAVIVSPSTGERAIADRLHSPYNIYYDEHGVAGQPGHYQRLCIKCPLVGAAHYHDRTLCQKYRNIGPGQCGTFGQREPELFLLAWADAADKFESRALHMKFKPQVTDMQRALHKYGALEPNPQ